jgi:hypothetical protein
MFRRLGCDALASACVEVYPYDYNVVRMGTASLPPPTAEVVLEALNTILPVFCTTPKQMERLLSNLFHGKLPVNEAICWRLFNHAASFGDGVLSTSAVATSLLSMTDNTREFNVKSCGATFVKYFCDWVTTDVVGSIGWDDVLNLLEDSPVDYIASTCHFDHPLILARIMYHFAPSLD